MNRILCFYVSAFIFVIHHIVLIEIYANYQPFISLIFILFLCKILMLLNSKTVFARADNDVFFLVLVLVDGDGLQS